VFGHKWETVRGTVVASRLSQTPAAGTHHQERLYTVDVQRANGSTLRAEVTALAFMNAELPAGSAVQLEWNPKTDEVRFDPHHPVARTPSAREAIHLARELRGEMASGGLAGAIAGLAEAAAEGKLGPGVHISTQSGEVHVSGAAEVRMVGGEQTAELMQALMAGGAQRAAAIEKMRQIKTDMLAQSGYAPGQVQHGQVQHGQVQHGQALPGQASHPGPAIPAVPEGFSSSGGPSTFDEVQAAPPVTAVPPVSPAQAAAPAAPAVTFSSPAPAFGQPTASFGPPVTPPAFGQVAQQPAFGDTGSGSFGAAPSGSGSFGGSFGQDSKAARIARIQDMRHRGQLTQEQFETQRQQIMDEI
jgi:hypothetical protein